MTSIPKAPGGDDCVDPQGGQPAKSDVFRRDVPIGWIATASKLPGKSLHAGIALWYAAGLTRSRAVPLSNLAGHRFGLDRNAKYRALTWLEKAGLIVVERALGKAPIVTILETGGSDDRES